MTVRKSNRSNERAFDSGKERERTLQKDLPQIGGGSGPREVAPVGILKVPMGLEGLGCRGVSSSAIRALSRATRSTNAAMSALEGSTFRPKVTRRGLSSDLEKMVSRVWPELCSQDSP